MKTSLLNFLAVLLSIGPCVQLAYSDDWALTGAEFVVAVSSNQVMAWAIDGKVQFGMVNDVWSPVLQLPITSIIGATTDKEGVLVSGVIESAKHAPKGTVLLINNKGEVLEKWVSPSTPFLTMASQADNRWAATSDAIGRLKSGSQIERVHKVEGNTRTVVLLPSAEQEILCADKSSSNEPFLRTCRSVGRNEWDAEGTWIRDPFLCGGYIVEQSQVESDECIREEIILRSIDSGKEIGQYVIPKDSVLTCSSDSGIVIAKKKVAEVSLPDFRKRWEFALRERDEEPISMVDTGKQVAILTNGWQVIFRKKRS